MGRLTSRLVTLLGRLMKAVTVVLLIPLAIGLLQGVTQQLDLMSASRGVTFLNWIRGGFVTYLWVHLLLYRPAPIFQASHRLFSAIATWLFGGQVASVEGSGGKGKEPKGNKGGKADAGPQGSTLVAFSPYVIPLYTVLVCVAGWLLGRWFDRAFVDGPVTWCIGMTIAFHWLMTADHLQQQRAQWHLETYVLAVVLVFALTLVIGAACLPWAIPEFSFVRALSDGLTSTQAIYTMVVQRLFF